MMTEHMKRFLSMLVEGLLAPAIPTGATCRRAP